MLANFHRSNYPADTTLQPKRRCGCRINLSDLKVKVQTAGDARLAYERQHRSGSWMINRASPTPATDGPEQRVDRGAERPNAQEALFEFAKAETWTWCRQLRRNTSFQELTKKRAEVYSNYHGRANHTGRFSKGTATTAQLKELDSNDGRRREKYSGGAARGNDYTRPSTRRLLSEELKRPEG